MAADGGMTGADVTMLGLIWAAISAAFITMGTGFLYLLGDRKTSIVDLWKRLDGIKETHGAERLSDAKCYLRKDDFDRSMVNLKNDLNEHLSSRLSAGEGRIREIVRQELGKSNGTPYLG